MAEGHSAVPSSHTEHLLAEVESSDGLLGPTLRYVIMNMGALAIKRSLDDTKNLL